MDYTLSDAYATDASSGHRMHQDTAAVTTEWTAKDANSVIWSLMAVLNAANVAPQQFDPTNPATYTVLLQALNALFLTRGKDSWQKSQEGQERLYFADHDATSIRGGGTTPVVIRDATSSVIAVFKTGGRMALNADASGTDEVPRLGQVADLIALACPSVETTASDASYSSNVPSHVGSTQWVRGLLAKYVLGSTYTNVTPSNGTWVTNSSGHPIEVIVVANVGVASSGWGNIYAATTDRDFGEVIGISNDARSCGSFTMTVPAGKQWRVAWDGYVNAITITTLS